MPTRKRPHRDGTAPEISMSLPTLVGLPKYSGKHKMKVYEAVDYLGTRFRLGDHVSMYAPDGAEWVCVLEVLYRDEKTDQAMFKGRWFWSISDFAIMDDLLLEPIRESKCESHELIACDSRDSNLVESIRRKCYILSLENFLLVKKTIAKPEFASEKVFFCERQFYHKAYRFSEMNALLFPGDNIPNHIRKAADLPEGPECNQTDKPSDSLKPMDVENAYFETDVTTRTRRTKPSKGDKTASTPEPIMIW